MKNIEEQATGGQGAGDYRKAVEELGFPICKVYDWTSSAGDWTFLVSRDGEEWQILSQTNNYPRSGFTYTLDDAIYDGTFEAVCEQITEQFN